MATKIAEAFLVLRAEDGRLVSDLAASRDKVSAGAGKVGQAFRKRLIPAIRQTQAEIRKLPVAMAATTAKVTGMAAGIGARFKALGASIAASAGLIGGGFLIFSAFKTVVDFEDTMVSLRINTRLLGKEGEESFKRLEENARRLGATTRFTAVQAADAMNKLALAGLDVNEVIGASKPVLDLATAANIDLAEAAEIATTQMKIFNFTAKDLNRVSDTLVSAQSRVRATTAQIGEALAISGALAKKAGLEFEDTAAILGLMIERSKNAALSGTALGIAIFRLAAPPKEAAKALKDLGINLEDFRKASGEVDILPLLKQISDLGLKIDELKPIFGARGKEIIKLFEAVDSEGRKGVDAAIALADALRDDVGFAAQASAARMETFKGKLLELLSAFQELAISLLGPVLDGLLAVLRPMTSMIRAIARLNEKLGGFISNLGSVALGLAIIAFTLPLISKGLARLGKVLAAFRALAIGSKVLVIALVAIVLAVAGLISLFKKFSGTSGKIGEALGRIGNSAAILWKQIRDNFENFVVKPLREFWTKTFGESLEQGVERGVLFVLNSLDEIIQGFGFLMTNIDLFWETFQNRAALASLATADFVVRAFRKIKQFVVATGAAIAASFMAVSNNIGEAFFLAFRRVSNLGDALAAGIEALKAGLDFGEAFSKSLENAENMLPAQFKDIGKATADAFNTAMAEGVDVGDTIFTEAGREAERESKRLQKRFAIAQDQFSRDQARRLREVEAERKKKDDEEDEKKKLLPSRVELPVELKPGFKGIADLSRTIQQEFFKQAEDDESKKQTKSLEGIDGKMGDAVGLLQKIQEKAFGDQGLAEG